MPDVIYQQYFAIKVVSGKVRLNKFANKFVVFQKCLGDFLWKYNLQVAFIICYLLIFGFAYSRSKYFRFLELSLCYSRILIKFVIRYIEHVPFLVNAVSPLYARFQKFSLIGIENYDRRPLVK